MLLSSFLGLGCGVMLARRALGLTQLFPALLFILVIVVFAFEGVRFAQGPDELRFLFDAGLKTTTLPIILIFALNASVFVPLGGLIGTYFCAIPSLRAYSWDICGAITGTLVFGLLSYFWFSPLFGFALVMLVFLSYCTHRAQVVSSAIFFILIGTALFVRTDTTGIWSPYNLLSMREIGPNGSQTSVLVPPENIANLIDPPFYTVQVNHDFYMVSGTIDSRRYSKHSYLLGNLNEQYTIPHRVRPAAKDVLIVGSGGGVDVEAALLAGAERVDALEIDPVIIRLGHQFNASQSYKDPRVTVFNTDARAFFRRTHRSYDMIVFGFLDSQGLFSQMTNIRLDGYVYTRESFEEAFRLLKPGGLMSVSFFAARSLWLFDRLISMVRSASGSSPIIYTKPTGQVIILAAKGSAVQAPTEFKTYSQVQRNPPEITEALDDWPYLYLRTRSIPLDYTITIGFLLLVSLVFIFLTFERTNRRLDLHFFFLGAGFLLLEMKSITTISLYLGATWLVSMVVILGVLIMVLLANFSASRLKTFSLLLYVPLVASVCFLYFFPHSVVLTWSYYAKFLYSVLVIPLPIFFAGLIFSLSFRTTENPSFAFGSNLIGAMVGGFLEYLGMITGSKTLLLIVVVLYLASLATRIRRPLAQIAV
jgi:SAM-dependent methyltransferase